MADLIPTIKGTCEDCRTDLDFAVGCDDPCISAYRMSSCRCLCILMDFQACATVVDEEDCLCVDGSTHAPGFLITGAWIGFLQPTPGYTMTQLAAITSPEDPHAYYRFYGANDLTNIDCPTSTFGWDLLEQTGFGTVVADWGDVPITRDGDGKCIGGAFLLDTDQLGITIVDEEKCLQTGGRRAFLMEITDGNGKLLALCPFGGIGTPGQCTTLHCGGWNLSSYQIDGCDEEGGSATLTLIYTSSGGSECPLSAEVDIDGTVYPLGSSPQMIEHTITPCTPGTTVNVTLTQTYDPECIPTCADTSFTDHYTI